MGAFRCSSATGLCLLFLASTVSLSAQITPTRSTSLRPLPLSRSLSQTHTDYQPFLPSLPEKHDHARRHHRALWFGWGMAAAMSVADVEMTVHCEHMPGCSEGNPSWGTKNPGRMELYAPRGAIVLGGVLLSRRWNRQGRSKLSMALMLITNGVWGVDTAWDAHVLGQSR